jgi:ribonuclease BN (tRNA processing enzyme)
VEIHCGEQVLVFDAGSGARPLGRHLERSPSRRCRIFFSHFHADHTEGFPFFAPLRRAGWEVEVFGAPGGRDALEATLRARVLAREPIVALDDLEAAVSYRDLSEGLTVSCGEAVVTHARMNHPGGVSAYRIDFGGHAVVYATDTEHFSCPDPKLGRLAEQADLLIYDATFSPEEYAGRSRHRSAAGLGHSTYEQGAKMAEAAGVRHLILFHHHPERSDEEVEELEGRCRRLFKETTAARERMTIELL